MADPQSNIAAIWSLGVTQIIGYGTLYYSFSILVPHIAADFDLAPEWIYGCMSLALLVGGLISPYAGGLADKHGAARVLSLGSLGAAAALAVCGLAGNALVFLVGVVLMELASAFVLYSTAFALLAQATGPSAQRSITLLTLIAGFASSIFWPMTSWLLESMAWHQIYLVFAGLNALICLPLHLWLTHFARIAAARPVKADARLAASVSPPGELTFVLMVFGFSLAGFVSAATLFHMVPMISLLGLGPSGVLIASLLGPAQVAVRLINMSFGKDLAPGLLAVFAASAMPIALAVLVISAPSVGGGIAFSIIFGFGTGLFSIVSGTLPLSLFGKAGFGKRMGWIGLGRLCLSALAPFALSVALGALGPRPSLWMLIIAGCACVTVFFEIWRRTKLGSGAGASSSQPA